MDKKLIKEILDLNKHFYEYYAKDFSLTRTAPWSGWANLVKNFKDSPELKVIDIGCGNGRFLGYLLKCYKGKLEYLGFDLSKRLIAEAKMNYQAGINTNMITFSVMDFLDTKTNNLLNKNANLVVGFGIMHHIPTIDLRKEFVNKAAKLVAKNGYLVLTFWKQMPRVDRIFQNLDNGDYFIKWGNTVESHRYIHIYNENEVTKYETMGGFKLINKYEADGKKQNSNLYLVWKKL